MTAVRYDVARGPSGGPTPGAIAIRDHWRIATGLADLGIYNPRRIRGAAGWSIHAEGRAVDLAANAHDADQRETADRYCQFLIDNAERLQVQYLIWNRRSWKPGRGWRTYTGTSPHTDHIHAEQNRDGARDVTLALLVALWSDWTDDHTATPPEDIVPELEIIAAFADWLGRPPSDDELAAHVYYAAEHGVGAAVLNIARSDEAKARR